MTLYRKPTRPFKQGQLRMKAWRALLPPTPRQDDPTWTERCKQYWELQERLYGIKLSDFTMILNANEGVVATYAVVMDIMPGERTLDIGRVPAVHA